MGRQGSWLPQLTIALHGLLGRQDERCETGEGLRQLQERMLHRAKDQQRQEKEEETGKPSESSAHLIKTIEKFNVKRKSF